MTRPPGHPGQGANCSRRRGPGATWRNGGEARAACGADLAPDDARRIRTEVRDEQLAGEQQPEATPVAELDAVGNHIATILIALQELLRISDELSQESVALAA